MSPSFPGRIIAALSAALVLAVVVAPPAWADAPSAPAQPSVVPGDAQIAVSFDAPFDGGSAITGYDAACVSSDGGVSGAASGSDAPIAVGLLSNGNTYTCTVTATNADGTSESSPVSDGVIPSTLPDAPAQPSVVAGDAELTVSFVAPFDGGSAITGYVVACVSSDGGVDGSASGAVSPIVVGSLSNGNSYSCTVTATNANGTSAQSPSSAAGIPSTIPSAPAEPPTATVGNGALTVSFVAPSNGGSAITRYDATCTSSNGGAAGSNSGLTSPIVVGSLSNGKTYTCTLTATNVNGTSAPSPASAVVVPSTIPSAPGQPTADVGNGQLTVSFVPPFNGGSPISGYRSTCVSSNGGPTGSATGASSPLLVIGLANGKSYTCTVIATNSNGDSAASAPSAVAVPNRVPDAPAQPTVTPANAQVNVAFVTPFDGGSPITGFSAVCASSNGGVAGSGSGAVSPIVVGSLSNGKSYTCKLTATNANGTSVPSPASAVFVPSNVPNVPARPNSSAGDGQVTVSFAAPFNGGSAITSYTATCVSSNGGKSGSRVGPKSPLTVIALTNGKSYTCKLSARNANGTSHGSAPSTTVVPNDSVSIQAAHGFRLFAGDGGVFTFGDAGNYGSAAGVAQHSVVGMASTANNRGYWLVASDGGIFSFGNARFFGSTGAIRLNQPIVGIAATQSGNGYWLVASDGGIFSFGDALFRGSAAGVARSRVAGMAATATGRGYWIAATDGSVFAFGDAPRLGGLPAGALRLPIAGIASTPTGKGYWLAAGDGGLFAFGGAPYFSWLGPLVLRQRIRGVSR